MYVLYIQLFAFLIGTLVTQGVGVVENKEYLIFPRPDATEEQLEDIYFFGLVGKTMCTNILFNLAPPVPQFLSSGESGSHRKLWRK